MCRLRCKVQTNEILDLFSHNFCPILFHPQGIGAKREIWCAKNCVTTIVSPQKIGIEIDTNFTAEPKVSYNIFSIVFTNFFPLVNLYPLGQDGYI